MSLTCSIREAAAIAGFGTSTIRAWLKPGGPLYPPIESEQKAKVRVAVTPLANHLRTPVEEVLKLLEQIREGNNAGRSSGSEYGPCPKLPPDLERIIAGVRSPPLRSNRRRGKKGDEDPKTQAAIDLFHRTIERERARDRAEAEKDESRGK